MANDGKTMSDLFMSLMQGLDDEDEKKKRNLIPGTTIPSVMSQFQDIPQGPQMVPDSPQLFRSQMTVPEPEQFKVPEKSTPPIAPYQDAGDYMAAYREANKEAIDAIPRKDMLRADGSTKSAQGYLGAFPDKYGKMMTEQTIGVEIDGKEVQMPAIVPTTTPDEIELLSSGNVNWQSPRGQLIQDKAVANYRDRVSRGLSPYYQDGESDVPPVQEVPKPAEVGGPAYSYGNLGVKPVSTVLDLSDPNLYDPSTGNLKPEYQKQAEAQFDPNKLVEVGGPAYSYGNLGVKPPVDTSALEEFRPDLIGKDPSSYIPKPEPTFSQEANLPTWMGSPLDAMRASGMPAAMANDQARIDFLKEQVAKGNMDPAALKEVERLEERIKNNQKTIDTYEKEKLADKKFKVQRLRDAGLIKEANALAEELGVPNKVPDSPMVGLGGVPKLEPEPELEVKPPLRVVTAADVDKSASDLGDKAAGDVDTAVTASGVKPGGTVATKTDPNTGEEEVVVVDKDGNEDPGFFKSLWNGIKDIAKEGFENPTMRKALFAYTASKVLGYDGVTLASAVLENEWQKQAAQAKADLELEKLYGEKQAEAIKNQRADPSKVFTVYDSASKTNYTGAPSIDGTLFYPDNPQIFGVEAGQPVSLSVLRTFENGRFKAEKGETKDDLQVKFMERSGKKAKAVIAQISKELELDDTMEGTEKADLIKSMNLATDPEIMRESNLVFLSSLHPNLNPNDQQVIQAQNRGITEWLRAIKDGRSVDNKDFSAFLDLQRMKLNLSQDGVPKAFLTIPSDKDAEIGVNAFSKIKNGITNSPQAADLNMDFPTVMGKLATIFDKKSANDTRFKKKYQGKSVESLKGSKSEYVSPFLAYAADAFASDNKDIAELMAELKK